MLLLRDFILVSLRSRAGASARAFEDRGASTSLLPPYHRARAAEPRGGGGSVWVQLRECDDNMMTRNTTTNKTTELSLDEKLILLPH